MLTMVTAKNIQGNVLSFPLADSSGGYIVRDIKGLDPVKAALVSSDLAQIDGAQFQHARRETRNILITLGLEPNYVSNSVDSLRSVLYDFFMPKFPVTLSFYKDDVLFAATDAIVETCENSMFSSDPEVVASLICYDPDFYDTDVTTVSGNTVSDTSTQVIPYDGSSDAGVVFTITFPGSADEIVLYNIRQDGITNIFRVNTNITGGSPFQADDVLVIDSRPGQKAVTMTRAGLQYSVLYYKDTASTWISLMRRSDNLFRAYYNGSPIPFTLEYTARYGGL